MNIKKIDKKFEPDSKRVIIKPHIPTDSGRIRKIITRILGLPEEKVKQTLDRVVQNFSNRHKNIWSAFEGNYNKVEKYIPQDAQVSKNRKALIGAYFSCEYSVQAAAFFNPSIVAHPNQADLPEGSLRFILSFRSVGEGHISSVEFRSGVVDKNCDFTFDKVSPYAQKAEVVSKPINSNYEMQFRPGQDLSEKIIFPASDKDSNGIEDARFVRFADDDGSITYYATYTAYDGHNISPQIIETKDFNTFKITALSGDFSKNKGMALFPRKINGRYAMISRVDGENLYIMYSEDIRNWQNAELLKEPESEWEFIQVGNCGSPIETDKGWVLLTHGVGPMREYCIGIILLGLENPNKIVGNMYKPLLICNEEEREGYVPNVVYSCGAITHNDSLVIPYAMSDTCSGIVTISLPELFENMEKEERDRLCSINVKAKISEKLQL